MSESQKPSFFRKAALVAWAMFTLILAFTVVLLANEMMKSGKNPMDLARVAESGAEVSSTPASMGPGDIRDVPIYAASADGRMLVVERRSIPLGDFTVENCRAALIELRKPGASGNTLPVLPPGADATLYLMPDGQLVIDFSVRLQAEAARSASAEALMVYGVVNTLTQDVLRGTKAGPVTSVRVLIGGAEPGEAFPAHLDLSQPVTRDPQWILKTEAPQPSNG